MHHGLLLAAILFVLGMVGILVRRNLIFILMSIEIMLNAAGLAFVVAGSRWGQADGQVMFIFILSVAAAEVSVGLASCCCSIAASGRWMPMPRARCGDEHAASALAHSHLAPGRFPGPGVGGSPEARRSRIGTGSVGYRGARRHSDRHRLPRCANAGSTHGRNAWTWIASPVSRRGSASTSTRCRW